MKHRCAHRLVAVLIGFALATPVWSAEPPVAAASADGTPAKWVRRFGQIARISDNRLAEFKKLAGAPPAEMQSLLKSHGFQSQTIFVKNLGPGANYAFRFVEYAGNRLMSDVRQLTESAGYRTWKQGVDGCLQSPWTDIEEVFYCAGRTNAKVPAAQIQYHGQVVGLRPEMADAYKLLHAHAWPSVLAKIAEGNIRNYAVYWTTINSKMYLFAYFEYVGDNFATDMAAIDADPDTKAWIKFTDKGCQLPLETRKPGEWWAEMDRLSAIESSK